MNLTFRTRYWDDLPARNAFKAFIIKIHNLDFDIWEESGFWDDDYVPFSYFAGDQVVASVCIYTMPSVVKGEKCKVAQVSGVGTLPEYRLKGLNKELHKMALDWALLNHKFAFLFSDEDAIPFYSKCGFRSIKDYAQVVTLLGKDRKDGLQKLDMNDSNQLKSVYDLACRRAPISNVFSNMNPKLVMFHALYSLRNHVYRISELNLIVFMKREGSKTVIYDILAHELPRFDKILPYLGCEGLHELEFRFYTDLLDVPNCTYRELKGNDTHIMGKLDLESHFVVPFTAHA